MIEYIFGVAGTGRVSGSVGSGFTVIVFVTGVTGVSFTGSGRDFVW